MFRDIEIKYFNGTHRAIDPLETLNRNEKMIKIAGITRITDITNLDRIGIPVYSAIRPGAEYGGISVYAGKGVTKTQAKASAIMEGFERYSAEFQSKDEFRIKKGNFEDIENKVDLNDLIIPKNCIYDKDNIQWIKSIDIASEKEYYIPANAVFHPYTDKNFSHLFKSNTNGLASGNFLEEAVLHGIFEVVERDAWSIYEMTKKNNKQISWDSIENSLIKCVLNKFKDANINIKLIDITTDSKIPTVIASADDTILKDSALLTLGVGTHLNPEIAILRALTEVAQSRVTQIHGTREDTVRADFLRKAGYERMKKINKHYFQEDDDKINFEDIEDKSSNSLKTDIERSIEELNKCGLDKVLFTDLTRHEVGVNVVRVVIPKAEIYSVDNERIGQRLIDFSN